MLFGVSKPKDSKMYDVLYVPGLTGNLFSVGAAIKKGHCVQFDETHCHIQGKNGQLYGMGTCIEGNLYKLNCNVVTTPERALIITDNSEIDLWHQRLGHLNQTQLKKVAEKLTGMKIQKSSNMSFCEACVQGKIHRQPFKSVGEIRSKRKLQLVHSDVFGPIQPEAEGGYRYFVTFIDDYSRCCKVYFLKHKSEVLEKFKMFEAVFTNECGEKIGKLRTDNGGEYLSGEFQAYLKSKQIHHETTVRHTPQQNGVAERKNRTIVESARSMLSHAGLPKKYWPYAIDTTAVHVMNRTVTSAITDGTIPYQKWYERKPDLSHLKVFGCTVYTLVVDTERRKLDAKAEKLQFVGYAGENSIFFSLMSHLIALSYIFIDLC